MPEYGPSEAWMRDAAYNDPWSLIRALAPYTPVDRELVTTCARWREFTLPVGKIDLLIVVPFLAIVVEFKRDLADEAAIAQVLRYGGSLAAVPELREYRGSLVSCVVVAPNFTVGAQAAASMAKVILLKCTPRISYDDLHAEIEQPALADTGLLDELFPKLLTMEVGDLLSLVRERGADIYLFDGRLCWRNHHCLDDALNRAVKWRAYYIKQHLLAAAADAAGDAPQDAPVEIDLRSAGTVSGGVAAEPLEAIADV